MDVNLYEDIYEVCRTCLEQISYGSQAFYLDSSTSNVEGTIKNKLIDCIPELVRIKLILKRLNLSNFILNSFSYIYMLVLKFASQ